MAEALDERKACQASLERHVALKLKDQHPRSDRRAGLAAGHAPRRAGPEPDAAALVGRDRRRHAARTGITTTTLRLAEQPVMSLLQEHHSYIYDLVPQ